MKRVPFSFFIVLSIFVCLIITFFLFRQEFLPGWDAYYYALKTDAWFKYGGAALADGNFIPVLLTPFKWLRVSPEAAWKSWLGLSVFLFLISYALLLRNVKDLLFQLILFAWATLSPSMLYTAVDFPKTFIFLICFNLFLLGVLQKNYILVFLFSCLSVFAHKMALAYITPVLIWMIVSRSPQYRKKILFVGAAAGGFILFLQLFDTTKIDAADLFRLPAQTWKPGAISLFLRYNLPYSIRLEGILSLAGIFFLGWRQKSRHLLPILLILPAFIPAFSREPFGIGERFGLLLPYFLSLAFIYRLCNIPVQKIKNPLTARRLTVYALLLGAAAAFRLDYSTPAGRTAQYRRFTQITNALKPYKFPLLITPKHFNYFYTFITKNPSFAFAPEDHWDKTKIWRILGGISPKEISPFLPPHCQKHLWSPADTDISLIREDCYSALPLRALKETRPFLYFTLQNDAQNPWKKRPQFLYKKHAMDPSSSFSAFPERERHIRRARGKEAGGARRSSA